MENKIKEDKVVSIHKMITYTDGEVELIEVDENGKRKEESRNDVFKDLYEIVDVEENEDIYDFGLDDMPFEPCKNVEYVIYLINELINMIMTEHRDYINDKNNEGKLIDLAIENIVAKDKAEAINILEAIDWYIPGKDKLLIDLIFYFIDEISIEDKEDDFRIKHFCLIAVSQDIEDQICINEFFKYKVDQIYSNKNKNMDSYFYV